MYQCVYGVGGNCKLWHVRDTYAACLFDITIACRVERNDITTSF